MEKIEIFRLVTHAATKALKWLLIYSYPGFDRPDIAGIRVGEKYMQALNGLHWATIPTLLGMEDLAGKHLRINYVMPAGEGNEIHEIKDQKPPIFDNMINQLTKSWKEAKSDIVINAGMITDFVKLLPKDAMVRIIISKPEEGVVFMSKDKDGNGNRRHAFVMPMCPPDRVFYDPYNMEDS